MTPCPRCGRSDGQHVGYHEDAELPIERGDRVRVRAGAEIRTTLPDPSRRVIVNKRVRVITVLSMDCGRSDVVGYAPGGTPIYRHLDDPGVCWPGAGGYWHHAKLSDVERVESVAVARYL